MLPHDGVQRTSINVVRQFRQIRVRAIRNNRSRVTLHSSEVRYTHEATKRRRDGVRMAKRDDGTKRTKRGTTTTNASRARTTDAIEPRVVAFAEELGRIAGTFQATAEGWLDRETLKKQIASVRDGAADLLKQLAGGATKALKKTPAVATVRGGTKDRSGGMVDAPGKKHRKPMPTVPGAGSADSQAAKMRTAKTMIKTTRRRGRG
jgi:hypothetical protein